VDDSSGEFRRKRRTREHIIADLGVNYFERFVLRRGHTATRINSDYGVDLLVNTFTEQGEVENEAIRVQLKSGDNPSLIEGRIALRTERRDLEFWYAELLPVVLVFYHAGEDQAYWLHMQEYLRNIPNFNVARIGQTYTIYFNRNQLVSDEAIDRIVQQKRETLSRVREALNYAH
jgi:hypothetical protein